MIMNILCPTHNDLTFDTVQRIVCQPVDRVLPVARKDNSDSSRHILNFKNTGINMGSYFF